MDDVLNKRDSLHSQDGDLFCKALLPVIFCEMIREACESGRLLSAHVSNVLERCFFFHNKVITANVSVCFSS